MSGGKKHKKDELFMPNHARGKSGMLYVYRQVSKGISPSYLWKNKMMPERTVLRHVKSLSDSGYLIKIGHGVWEATVSELTVEMYNRTCQKVHRVTPTSTCQLPANSKPDTDRMHAVRVTLRIPKMKNWDRRAELLRKNGIKFKPIVQGQSLSFRDIDHIWLCKESIIMYLPYSWFADTSHEALKRATMDVIALIGSLERYLRIASLKMPGGYQFRFSTQHHALIKNALASLYNKEGKRLQCFDETGLWCLIDDSLNLNEFEFVDPKRSPEDHAKMQTFLNEFRKQDHPEQVFSVPQAIERFEMRLAGSVQADVATKNAMMMIGTTLERQTAILERLPGAAPPAAAHEREKRREGLTTKPRQLVEGRYFTY